MRPAAKVLALALLLPGAAFAADGDMMTADEFEAYVEGTTLYYAGWSGNFGIEQYLPGRRVVWKFLEDDCQYGKWYANASGQICFVYEQDPEPKCWSFWQEDGKLAARFENMPGNELYEARNTTDPLQCRGPAVGS
jgi:hypothetical protein